MASEQELNDWQRRCYALVDEKYALEQQLAQARAQAESFNAEARAAAEDQDRLRAENAAMQALLERVADAIESYDGSVNVSLAGDIRDLLAQHKEPSE